MSVARTQEIEQSRSPAWTSRLVMETRVRGHFLWFDVDFDVAEMIVVIGLWANLGNRLGYLKEPHALSIYKGLNLVAGEEALTAILLFLAVLGVMAVLLILPSIRRNTILAIGAYFALSGIIFFITVPGNLSGWYHLCVFAPSAAWAYWRLGEEEVKNVRRRKP